MTHQAPPSPALPGGDPGRQVASLREALVLVRSVCGEAGAERDAMLEEAAQVSSAYERASPIAQRRFDAMAGEMAAWAAAGVEALLGTGDTPPQAPARRLAGEMETGLDRLRALLRVS